MVIDSFRGYYKFLSNFDNHLVTYAGILCLNSEAAFQMMKTHDIELRNRIARMEPSEAKRFGKTIPLREDWEQVKDDIMYDVVKTKFLRNPDIREKLLETGDATLIEGNTWGDTYWGQCNGVGDNRLGKILMRVRDEIRSGNI